MNRGRPCALCPAAENVGEGTKKEQTQAHRTALDEPDAPLSCSERPARAQQHGSELWSPVRDEEAAGSNPVTPTHRHRSLTCVNAALRRPAFHSRPPADAPKEQKRNTREPQGKQTPRHSSDPQGTLIPRPQRRGRLVGTPARQEAVPIRNRQARQARDRQRAPPSAEDPVDRSAPKKRLCADVASGATDSLLHSDGPPMDAGDRIWNRRVMMAGRRRQVLQPVIGHLASTRLSLRKQPGDERRSSSIFAVERS